MSRPVRLLQSSIFLPLNVLCNVSHVMVCVAYVCTCTCSHCLSVNC
jgi:hypothetical protein